MIFDNPNHNAQPLHEKYRSNRALTASYGACSLSTILYMGSFIHLILLLNNTRHLHYAKKAGRCDIS
jgi:hypothetical protein